LVTGVIGHSTART